MKLLLYLYIYGMKNQTKVDKKYIFKSWKLTNIFLTGIPTTKLDIKYKVLSLNASVLLTQELLHDYWEELESCFI